MAEPHLTRTPDAEPSVGVAVARESGGGGSLRDEPFREDAAPAEPISGRRPWRDRGAPSAARPSAARYRRFWADVGDQFPDLGGARSTAFYRRDEERLFRDYLPSLDGLRVMKTDLWDEAKNTRILRWAAAEGAVAFGVDISPPIVFDARRGFGDLELRAPVSDIRWLPFRDASFDAVYSMGTIEHFLESEQAVEETFRVLRPGGRLILGVPNRFDPFLRPLLVALLYRLGLYGYGYEKCYSRRALRRMLEAAGFEVVAESGILFVPGWLRMLDLACHTWVPPLARITGAAAGLFAALARRVPFLHRHGYLLASVGVRPPAGSAEAQTQERP